jgi:hypothetical protein
LAKTKAKLKRKGTVVRKKRRRVFILGAGASASCGIAVARDILREAMQRLSKKDAKQSDKVHDLLRYLYPGFNEDLSNYPNVEDFLNLVEMAKEFHTEAYIESKRWTEARLQEAADISLRAITEYIWGFMAESDRRRVLYDLVGELVRPGDVIVSFNWDFMIDLALEDLDEDNSPVYSYSSSRKSVVLLKPHGSIDWFEKSRLPADKKLLKEMQHRATGVCFYPYFQLAQNPDLLKYPAFIVPPLSVKKFGGFLQRVWRDVYRAVGAATELYIIGYSLPREDQFARLVIGRAIQRNNSARKDGHKRLPVIVVNPDEAAMATFAKLVGTGVRFFQTSLQDYVTWLREQRLG